MEKIVSVNTPTNARGMPLLSRARRTRLISSAKPSAFGSMTTMIVAMNSLNVPQLDWGLSGVWLALPTWTYGAFGLATLAVELLYPTVLVWPRARRVLPALAAVLHLGVLVTQGMLFLDLLLLQLVFVDVPSRR